MDMQLAYRCQMFPDKILNSRVAAVQKLLNFGWAQEAIYRDIDEALSWARSHRLTVKQEKFRQYRHAKKTQLKDDDALDAMFQISGADPSTVPRRKELGRKANGNATGLMGAQHGETVMALGFNYSTGAGDNGDIVPFVKYDARAGRFFRNDRTEQNGAYTNNAVDITSNFKAVMDLENLEVGYLLFAAGAAPAFMLVKLGEPMPHKPADGKWKQGVRVMMKLHQSCGGDVRETSSNAAAFLKGFDDLHSLYEAQKAANPGKLPIVTLKTTVPITSGSGEKKSTNYQPVFEITGWAPRPVDLVHVSKGASQPTQNGSGPAAAPSTGSTQVGAPPAKQLETAGADDFG